MRTKQNVRYGLICGIGIALLAGAPANAASCAVQIDQVQAQLDAALAQHAKTAPYAVESKSATLSRQPTPGSIARAEEKTGAWSDGDKAVAALGRARDAQAAGQTSACFAALREAKRAIASP
ncbi:MAG: hypothetical protein K2X60_07415 [Xanthobacteraceae bacterium]|nr:hypothetical protein [Xanthobacteraceae bacterium]